MATDRAAVLSVPAAAALLLWPALWNGYPIVFADTGTYLSQAIHRYAGWDRPVFYSLFMLPLHATVTTWPVVVVQALLAAWVLRLACRALVPGWSEATFLAVVAALSLSTWLPWIVCMLMPDVFTPLLVLVLCLLGVVPARMARWERIVLAALATFMIASQLSSLPLACALAGVLLAVGHMAPSGTSIVGYGARSSLHRHGRTCPGHLRFNGGGWMAGTRPAMTISAGVTSPAQSAPTAAAAMTRRPRLWRLIGATAGHRPVGAPLRSPTPSWPGLSGPSIAARAGGNGPDKPGHDGEASGAAMLAPVPWRLVLLPPALAILGLCAVNLAAHGRISTAPFGNIFLLARVVYDGPGMAVLQRDCPAAGWRLCAFLDRFPPATDDFLWQPDSPLNRAGGPKAVSQEAGAIIAAAVSTDPGGMIRSALANTLAQLSRFDSGDGLQPWPDQVTPWIERDFPPAERMAHAAASQQRGQLTVPPVLATLHRITALLGVAGCIALLPSAVRRRGACLGFLLAALVVLPIGAAITGTLSGPHDRYQARLMWLPPFVAAVSVLSLRRVS